LNRKRCSWVRDDPIAIRYHDEEYGRPIKNDDELFERLALEIFQAGLNWRMILHKQDAFRRAFSGFSIERVANFTQKDIERLMNDDGIVRNRMKIEATIENARRLKRLIEEHGSFASFIGGLGGKPDDMFREFKKRFRFMGPKIAESFLQSIGKIDTVHEPDCWKAKRHGRSPR
jgi:DNA-3-methyladenine glycosylase I